MGCCGLVSYCDGDRANPGVNISVGTGDAYEQISGTLPLFTVLQNPVREQSTVTLRFAGQPGDQVYLLASSETSFAPSLFKGVQLIPRDAQTYVAILGNVDASGVLELTRLVPELGPGVQGDVLQMQSIHRNLAGEFTLGNPVSLVILDRAF
jgi:hypothetical protein